MNIDLEVALDMKALQKLIDRTIPGIADHRRHGERKRDPGGSAASAAEAKIAEDLAMKFAKATCACESRQHH